MSIENLKPTWIEYLYDIDIKSFYWPWPKEGWDNIKGYIFRTYILKNTPKGFTSFKVGPDCLRIIKIAVHPDYRRIGIGSLLMDDLVHIGISQKKSKLEMIVHEECKYLDWLRNRGWRATTVERGLFPDGTDGYTFERKVIQ